LLTRLNLKSFFCFSLVLSIFFITKPALSNDKDEKAWKIGASAGIEYDDNLTRIEQDILSGESDHAYIFEVNGSYRFLDTQDFELEASYDFYQSLYDDRSDFDFQSHGFNLGAAHEAENIDFGADFNYTTTSLGEIDFLDIFMLIPRMGIVLSPILYTDISYMFQDKNFQTDNRRDASNHSIGLTQFLFFMDSRAYFSGTYRLESEDAEGEEFDYLGHLLKAAIKIHGPLDTVFKASYQYKLKDYDNITPSIGEERKDTKNTIKVALSKSLYEYFNLKLSYEHIASESNLATVDFNENILSFLLGVHF